MNNTVMEDAAKAKTPLRTMKRCAIHAAENEKWIY